MARAREVVIVAGKGHQDWQEYWDGADFENRETLKVGNGLPAWVQGCKGGWVMPGQLQRMHTRVVGITHLQLPACSLLPLSPLPLRTRPAASSNNCCAWRASLQSWFDDRVECRNALSKLSYLAGIKDLDRAFLPWTRYPEERDLLVGAGYSDVVPSDY